MSPFGSLPPGTLGQMGQPVGQTFGGSAGGMSGLAEFGGVMAIVGLVTQAVGGYYAARSDQYNLRARALSQEYEASISGLNAAIAEDDAVAIREAGKQQIGLTGLRYAQIKAGERVSQAARGLQGGVGSAAEVQASIEYAKQVDLATLESNVARQASISRMRAVDLRNRAMLGRVSAANLRGAARSISPWMQAFSSLLGGAGQVAGQWAAIGSRG